jgi:hypothetical protein
MMIRAATTDPFSLADAAAVITGLLVIGAVVFCVSMCAQDSPSISDFLHRTQSEADASRFHELLGALDEPQQASHLIASAERTALPESQTASRMVTSELTSTAVKRDRGGGAYRSELQAMYNRAIGPGVLKPRQAAPTVRQNGVDL